MGRGGMRPTLNRKLRRRAQYKSVRGLLDNWQSYRDGGSYLVRPILGGNSERVRQCA